MTVDKDGNLFLYDFKTSTKLPNAWAREKDFRMR